MKIIFVVNNLNNGGMQKALINFVNELSGKFDITICLLEYGGEMRNQLNNNIKIINQPIYLDNFLKMMATHKNELKQKNKFKYIVKGIVRYLSKIGLESLIYKIVLIRIKKINGFDLAISYTGMPGLWDKFVLWKINTKKKITWIHNNPEVLGIDSRNCFRNYNEFDAIINVSNDCKNRFEKIEPRLIGKSHLIYNLININEIEQKSLEIKPYGNKEKMIIVTVARLDNVQKRFDRIIECCKLLVNDGVCNFKWFIVGNGPDHLWLENQIKDNGLDRFIELVGFKQNPYPYIKEANLLVLTSDFEGLPVTIMEALVLRVPIVSTDFNCAREAIEEHVTGIIVKKSGEAVYEAVKNLILNNDLYMNLKNNVMSYDFQNQDSIKDFEKIIEKEEYEN
ncbi:glycosyltransferase [Peribacillus frigoritolerans]|uniref:glycosyltransferase n=1 Tax=Peribacillus frigoritolerans TaxID=450367 RepID=UPI0007BEC958|nr:glycosyltransferase [Peribacillus frigoritolerans]